MSLNNQHAERLRAIRADLLSMDADTPDAASLLAGAEALEAVEAAKAALLDVHDKADDWHSSVEWEGREYTGAVIETINAALARLEGK